MIKSMGRGERPEERGQETEVGLTGKDWKGVEEKSLKQERSQWLERVSRGERPPGREAGQPGEATGPRVPWGHL